MIMRICVYGASSTELEKKYLDEGIELGEKMAKRGHSLVFGGGANGLMGAVAIGMTNGGGHITGIAPSFFNVDGILYEHCTEFISTETMRERKKLLEDLSDAFVMSPGGIGTYEEFFEILTAKQLGLHNKAIAILNTNGYYDAMQQMLEIGVRDNFLKSATFELYKICKTPDEVLDYLENYSYEAKDLSDYKAIDKD